jgi:hypothetical protein
MPRQDHRESQISAATALHTLAPSLEFNAASSYVSLDTGARKAKPRNAAHLPFDDTSVSFFIPDTTLRERAASAGLELKHISGRPTKRRVTNISVSVIESHKDLFAEILSKSAADVEARQAKAASKLDR